MNKFLSRALVVALAYFFAVICAFAIIAVFLVINVALDEPGRGFGYVLSVSFVLMILAASILPLNTLLLPAIAIIIAEYASLRSWFYYAGAGAVTGIAGFFTNGPERSTSAPAGNSGILAALLLLAGLTGGLVYWRTAGRNAGLDAGNSGNGKK